MCNLVLHSLQTLLLGPMPLWEGEGRQPGLLAVFSYRAMAATVVPDSHGPASVLPLCPGHWVQPRLPARSSRSSPLIVPLLLQAAASAAAVSFPSAPGAQGLQ